MADESKAVATGQTFEVEMLVTVVVNVSDPLVLSRPIENTDGWRDDLYDLKTRDDVLNHLAFNAIANSVENGLILDGWADLPADAVTMEVSRIMEPWAVAEAPR